MHILQLIQKHQNVVALPGAAPPHCNSPSKEYIRTHATQLCRTIFPLSAASQDKLVMTVYFNVSATSKGLIGCLLSYDVVESYGPLLVMVPTRLSLLRSDNATPLLLEGLSLAFFSLIIALGP